MATNGVLDFQSTNKLIFRGTSANVVIDTQNLSLGVGHQGEGAIPCPLHISGNGQTVAGGIIRAELDDPGGAPYESNAFTLKMGGYSHSIRMELNTLRLNAYGNAGRYGAMQFVVGDGAETGNGQVAAMTISSGGDVGIGTTIPNGPLHISKSAPYAGDTGPGILFTRYSNTYGGCIWNESNGSEDGLYFNAFTNSAVTNEYGGTPDMVINSNGNVGVSTSNPLARLSVATARTVSRGAEWRNSDFVVSGFNGSTAGRSLGVAIGTNHDESASGQGSIWCIRPALTWNDLYFQCRNFTIHNVGGYSYTDQTTQITSDDRLKSEEEYLENALSTIMKLKPQKYRKAPFLPNDPRKEMTENMIEMPKDLSKIEAGLIVQDIWYDAPELRYLISLGKDANPSDTKPTDPDPSDPAQDPDYTSWGTTTSHLDYGGINIYLIKAVQELTLKNDALEARIAALENNISS